MEATVKDQVRKIVSDAIKLSYAVEYLHTVEAFRDLYSEELFKISDVASDLEHRLKPFLGYVEATELEEKFMASGEIKVY